MVASISNVVFVNITRQTTPVTRQGFGTGLILGTNGTFPELVRTYESLEEVLDDFSSSDDEYKAAAAYFGQQISPRVLKIARQQTQVAEVTELNFNIDFEASNVINATIQDVAIASVPFDTDHSTTLANLAAAIQASDFVATASVTGAREITVTAQTAGVPVNLDNVVVTGGTNQAVATLTITTENFGVADDLADILDEDKDWYALILTVRNKEVVKIAATFIETQNKIFGTCSSDNNILSVSSTTDIAAQLNALNRDRTFVIFNESPDNFPEAAILGRFLPAETGSITTKFKELSGVVASNLTASQRSNALNKKCNLYTEIGGVDIFEEGTMAGGEFIDVIRDVDWIQARMQENIYFRLVNTDKVPFTDAGIAVIENEMRGVLDQAVTRNILADDPAYTVIVPRAVEVDPADRALRFLPDLKFTGRLAGAIHKLEIRGTVTV